MIKNTMVFDRVNLNQFSKISMVRGYGAYISGTCFELNYTNEIICDLDGQKNSSETY